MSSIRTVNLLREQRVRGAYPISGYALDNDGSLTLAVPRPLEARTYDVTRLTLDGGAEMSGGFAVETLTKLEMCASCGSSLGMTMDDLYLFHAGSKLRFLGERRLLYIDAALSADAQRLVTIFSDIAGASFAIAYGEIGGRALWTRDLDVTPAVVAIARNGGRMALGAESGCIQMIDAVRRDVWEFGQPEAVRALACSENGYYVVYGTSLGGVGLVDGDGTRRWEARLPGEVIGLALTADGGLCAAMCRPERDRDTTLLFCLVGNGQIAWEHDAEQRLAGFSISPDGHYLATGARGGKTGLFEIVPGAAYEAGLAVYHAGSLRARAGELEAQADLEGAYALLLAALKADPADVDSYERLCALRALLWGVHKDRVQQMCAANDYVGAVGALEAVLRDDPLNSEAMTLLQSLRHEGGLYLLLQARERPESETAEADLLAALALAPDLIEARHELRALRSARAAAADVDAGRLLSEGRIEAAVEALEQAQSSAPDAERARRLSRVRVDLEFAAGMAAYRDRRYQEAVFQFKKALHLDPDHSEARRYLDYAQRFARDADSGSLNDRFSRLE